jgi:hypothetical protein
MRRLLLPCILLPLIRADAVASTNEPSSHTQFSDVQSLSDCSTQSSLKIACDEATDVIQAAFAVTDCILYVAEYHPESPFSAEEAVTVGVAAADRWLELNHPLVPDQIAIAIAAGAAAAKFEMIKGALFFARPGALIDLQLIQEVAAVAAEVVDAHDFKVQPIQLHLVAH